MPERQRLLVVDDDPRITETIAQISAETGFDVWALNDSGAFFSEYISIDPDILCIDIHMPDVDGIEILRWLSGVECHAAIIILSGGDPLFKTVAQRIGEAARLEVRTLQKPFQADDFRQVLRSVGDRDTARATVSRAG